MQRRRNDVKTFGGNEATKKNLLKQQYGNFKAEGSETLEHISIDCRSFGGNEEVNTASIPTASTQVSPAGPNVATASISLDTACAYIASQSNGSQVKYEDINQIDKDDIEEMDIKWNMALLSMRADKFWKKTGKKISIQGTDVASSDKSKVECFNCHKMGQFAREYRAPRSQDKGRRDIYRQGFMENEEENHALVADEEAPTEFALMAKSSTDNEVFDNSLCSKACKKNTDSLNSKITELNEKLGDTKNMLYHYKLGVRVPPLPAQVYSPPKKDLFWTRLPEFADDTITDYSRPSSAIESNSDDLQNKNSSVTETGESSSNILSKPAIKFVKAAERPTESKTDKVEAAKKHVVKCKNFKMKNKACFNCGDFNHLSYDCGKWVEHGKSRSRNNTHKSMPPRAVVHTNIRSPMRTNRPNMNAAQPTRTSFYKPVHSYLKRPFQRTSAVRSQFRGLRVSTVNRKFPTVNRKFPTGNTNFSTTDLDYEPFDGGYVSFGQEGCKITGKGIIKTECIVLGQNFKLPDDTNVLLRTPRQHNMYSIDLNNVVPYKDLTCLVVKASGDECMLWHRRLGHLNSKTMNRLVRHNLVKGLPSKCFDNDHTYVACLKGKQNKAYCKTKLVNLVTKPLHTLHMNLFGPTSVSSINHKWYCLVVTDDFSRFTWTFFLKTKDETSGILRNFITEIENLKDLKEKIIRCDNGGEFRNKEMNDSCSRKGIKREFLNARTPQQNGVAKRRNRTLIEAARTILSDAKLPVTFWAKAVNTAWKFDVKGDEGYFIGYSISSKAFRVFNKRTKRVEENLHVDFLENKAIEKGAGPNWLFDIDSLTNSMNYVPVVVAAHLESSTSNAQDACNADAPESSGNSNPTTTTTNPMADHMETLAVETLIPIADAPESSGNSNPTSTSTNPLADHMEILAVETLIPIVSSPVPIACLDDSP
nr:hypothetical protein [Tanacetum cinerariifolium]